MRPDLDQLQEFYAGRDGLRTAQLLATITVPAVRKGPGQRLLALGYPAPILKGMRPKTLERLAMVMPAAQGGHRWPRRGSENCAVISHDVELPFAAAMFDQALLVHALEFSNSKKLLRELWRVLAPAGEIVLIVPNRTGLWTHFEATPFGQGYPYGRRELTQILRDAMFEPVAWKNALVAPPVRGLRWLDRPLTRIFPGFGGIHFVLARKTDGMAPAAVGRARAVRATAPAQALSIPD